MESKMSFCGRSKEILWDLSKTAAPHSGFIDKKDGECWAKCQLHSCMVLYDAKERNENGHGWQYSARTGKAVCPKCLPLKAEMLGFLLFLKASQEDLMVVYEKNAEKIEKSEVPFGLNEEDAVNFMSTWVLYQEYAGLAFDASKWLDMCQMATQAFAMNPESIF